MSTAPEPVMTETPAAPEPASPASVPQTGATLLPEPPDPRHRPGLLAGVQSLAVTVVIAMFVITFLVQAFQIPSESMENTLLIGDYLLVDKLHFGQSGMWPRLLPYREVQRGDIIVFRFPVHPSQHFVKRVVAVPGDRLRMHNKHVLVNGREIVEDYVQYKGASRDRFRDDFPVVQDMVPSVDSRWWIQLRQLVHSGELVVPPGYYFVLGDNRDESLDSRYWGLVPRENIVGRPLIIYWSVEAPEATGAGVERLAMAVTQFFQGARWDRAFRIVK